ncbi:MAG: glucosaminidase domain-containing protein [Deltaproteobacteria bacterium]|nr:glucosaminidase domain-containing protein [Deltaproteobacteria bacterium]
MIRDPKKAFLENLAVFAVQTLKTSKIPASVILAQAALESNWGRSAPSFNFFGIKGAGPAGSRILWTTEIVKGKSIRVQQKFRKYHSAAECFSDYPKMIASSKWLRHALDHVESAEAYITALQSGPAKYATDTSYVSKILKIIKDYDLEILDKK